jgi:hypothetical protein
MRKPVAKQHKKAAGKGRAARHTKRVYAGKPVAKKPNAPEEHIVGVAALEEEPQFFVAETEEPELVGFVEVDEWRL